MDRERLLTLPYEALRDIARRSGMPIDDDTDQAHLIDQILEAFAEDRSDRERANNIEMLVKEKKFELNPDDTLEYTEIEEPVLPESYDETRIVLMLRDPAWAFAYWDLDSEQRHMFDEEDESRALLLRVRDAEPGSHNGSNRSFDIPVRGTERRWYVNLPRSGREYEVELVSVTRGLEQVLCRSNRISSPDTSIEEHSIDDELGYAGILSVAGVPEMDEIGANGSIPQRIISLLDTQYLHLKG